VSLADDSQTLREMLSLLWMCDEQLERVSDVGPVRRNRNEVAWFEERVVAGMLSRDDRDTGKRGFLITRGIPSPSEGSRSTSTDWSRRPNRLASMNGFTTRFGREAIGASVTATIV
jgi:hypothetical protein